MKRIFFLISLLIVGISYGQDTINNLKPSKMREHFLDEDYKDWEPDPSYISNKWDYFLKKGDKRVRIMKDRPANEIYVKESNIINQYRSFAIYDYNTKIIKSSGEKFYNFLIGKKKTYDQYGRLIKEEDFNKPYKIGVRELAEIVKERYKIDIIRINQDIYVYRDCKQKALYYIEIHHINPESYHQYRDIIIDATTGKTISDKIKDSRFPDDDDDNNTTSIVIEETTHPKELGVPYKQGGDYPAGTYRLYNDRAFTKKEWELYVKTRPWWERLFLS